jgi:hypothetical protein
MSSSTNLGTSERAAHSAERSCTCCSEGTCVSQFLGKTIPYSSREARTNLQEEVLLPQVPLGVPFDIPELFDRGIGFLLRHQGLSLPIQDLRQRYPLFIDTLDSSHAAVDHVNCDAAQVFVAVFLTKFLHLFLFFGNHCGESILQ